MFVADSLIRFRPGGLLTGENAAASSNVIGGGPPNRPLPPTPDDDAQGDRTLIMKRVSVDNYLDVRLLYLLNIA